MSEFSPEYSQPHKLPEDPSRFSMEFPGKKVVDESLYGNEAQEARQELNDLLAELGTPTVPDMEVHGGELN